MRAAIVVQHSSIIQIGKIPTDTIITPSNRSPSTSAATGLRRRGPATGSGRMPSCANRRTAPGPGAAHSAGRLPAGWARHRHAVTRSAGAGRHCITSAISSTTIKVGCLWSKDRNHRIADDADPRKPPLRLRKVKAMGDKARFHGRTATPRVYPVLQFSTSDIKPPVRPSKEPP